MYTSTLNTEQPIKLQHNIPVIIGDFGSSEDEYSSANDNTSEDESSSEDDRPVENVKRKKSIDINENMPKLARINFPKAQQNIDPISVSTSEDDSSSEDDSTSEKDDDLLENEKLYDLVDQDFTTRDDIYELLNKYIQQIEGLSLQQQELVYDSAVLAADKYKLSGTLNDLHLQHALELYRFANANIKCIKGIESATCDNCEDDYLFCLQRISEKNPANNHDRLIALEHLIELMFLKFDTVTAEKYWFSLSIFLREDYRNNNTIHFKKAINSTWDKLSFFMFSEEANYSLINTFLEFQFLAVNICLSATGVINASKKHFFTSLYDLMQLNLKENATSNLDKPNETMAKLEKAVNVVKQIVKREYVLHQFANLCVDVTTEIAKCLTLTDVNNFLLVNKSFNKKIKPFITPAAIRLNLAIDMDSAHSCYHTLANTLYYNINMKTKALMQCYHAVTCGTASENFQAFQILKAISKEKEIVSVTNTKNSLKLRTALIEEQTILVKFLLLSSLSRIKADDRVKISNLGSNQLLNTQLIALFEQYGFLASILSMAVRTKADILAIKNLNQGDILDTYLGLICEKRNIERPAFHDLISGNRYHPSNTRSAQQPTKLFFGGEQSFKTMLLLYNTNKHDDLNKRRLKPLMPTEAPPVQNIRMLFN